jgi:hypothetical protein
MKVIHARAPGLPSDPRTATFTGTVWGDPVMQTTDSVTINNVFFAPGGRTHWHSHELGQVFYWNRVNLVGKGYSEKKKFGEIQSLLELGLSPI